MGKSMKNIILKSLLVFLIGTTVGCKKEKSPELEITVLNSQNNPVRGIWVRTSIEGADLGIPTEKAIDSVRTDNFGKAFFEFDNTILVDVKAFFANRIVLDSTSVLLETKRLRRSEDNYYERTLRIN